MTHTSSGLPHPGRHNNSLDASGGSVKSLPISKLPIVDLIRAAASTQTLGGASYEYNGSVNSQNRCGSSVVRCVALGNAARL